MLKSGLAEDLNRINRVFKIEQVLRDADRDLTLAYYKQSEFGYRNFHSQEGSIHLALNEDGIFNPDGYYAQPRRVSQHLQTLQAKTVLEVGSGKGFNSIFLAKQHPEMQFTGVDRSAFHISLSRKQARGLPNLTFQTGQFDQLNFADQSFDLVFAVECFCYATALKASLAEVGRVLKPGGRFILFDGWRKPGFELQESALQTATRLVEISMAVTAGFAVIDEWITTAEQVGFRVLQRDNICNLTMPNLLSLQTLSRRYFRLIWRANLIARLLPKYLVRNSIAGLLMPYTFNLDQGSLGYYYVVLERT